MNKLSLNTLLKPIRENSIAKQMEQAQSYPQWLQLAEQHDEQSKMNLWRQSDESSLYNYRVIKERLDILKSLLRSENYHELLNVLNEGVHGNIEGIGRTSLYNKAKAGTKSLIEDYIDTVDNSLKAIAQCENSVISKIEKVDFFRRAGHCYGRSALMLSGGGGLIYFHHGVAQTLIDENLLPRILSGSSAGAWMCAQLGTRSDEELKNGYFSNLNYDIPDHYGKHAHLKVLMGLVKDYSPEQFLEHCLDQFTDDITFQEAYEKTGRYINISIAPAEQHQASRLMNAITSPNVYIRSAVHASSCVPGIVPAVRLYAKGSDGKAKPYLPSQKWVDGSFADDLPATRLARLFGVNHNIVSLINPAAIPFISDPKLQDRRSWANTVRSALIDSAQQGLSSTERLCSKLGIKAISPALMMADALINQNYTGDINIILKNRDYHLRDILFGYKDNDAIEQLKLAGARSTYPKIEMIRNTTKIARTLDSILDDLDQQSLSPLQGADKRRVTSAA